MFFASRDTNGDKEKPNAGAKNDAQNGAEADESGKHTGEGKSGGAGVVCEGGIRAKDIRGKSRKAEDDVCGRDALHMAGIHRSTVERGANIRTGTVGAGAGECAGSI